MTNAENFWCDDIDTGDIVMTRDVTFGARMYRAGEVGLVIGPAADTHNGSEGCISVMFGSTVEDWYPRLLEKIS